MAGWEGCGTRYFCRNGDRSSPGCPSRVPSDSASDSPEHCSAVAMSGWSRDSASSLQSALIRRAPIPRSRASIAKSLGWTSSMVLVEPNWASCRSTCQQSGTSMPQRPAASMHVASSSWIRGRGLTLMMCVDAAPLTGMSRPSSIGIRGICARPILPWVPASDRRDSSLLPARPDMLDATLQMPARAIFLYEPPSHGSTSVPLSRTMGARRRHRCNQGRRW